MHAFYTCETCNVDYELEERKNFNECADRVILFIMFQYIVCLSTFVGFFVGCFDSIVVQRALSESIVDWLKAIYTMVAFISLSLMGIERLNHLSQYVVRSPEDHIVSFAVFMILLSNLFGVVVFLCTMIYIVTGYTIHDNLIFRVIDKYHTFEVKDLSNSDIKVV
jgi:uncharacterized membrane protein YgdD (TMEM256/DUF423 family)